MLAIVAIVVAVLALPFYIKQIQGLLVWACVLLGLFLAIQTIGCESFAEKRERRKEERQQRWSDFREKRATPIVDDEESERDRRFRFRSREDGS